MPPGHRRTAVLKSPGLKLSFVSASEGQFLGVGWIEACLRFRHLFRWFSTSSFVKGSRRRLSMSLRDLLWAQSSLNGCCCEISFGRPILFSCVAAIS